ncbi:Imm21 family immunity protein [Streptomyces sp. NPDC008265]|uniref:Imm21 family immunity protein n=1 Tax=Streptomyces sp. NPDC008265 TaxID=3364824 RepID=UPI0036E5D3A1
MPHHCCASLPERAGDGTAPDGYDRACAVEDLAGVIPVGENGAQALVLADAPATSCYLPESRTFLRWLAAGSERGVRAAADAALADPATVWEECGTWESDGPAVLMDSAAAGSDLGVEYPDGGMPAEAAVPPAAGRPGPAPARRVLKGQRAMPCLAFLPRCSRHDLAAAWRSRRDTGRWHRVVGAGCRSRHVQPPAGPPTRRFARRAPSSGVPRPYRCHTPVTDGGQGREVAPPSSK